MTECVANMGNEIQGAERRDFLDGKSSIYKLLASIYERQCLLKALNVEATE